eukprot:905505-Rhodomonas_salina.1
MRTSHSEVCDSASPYRGEAQAKALLHSGFNADPQGATTGGTPCDSPNIPWERPNPPHSGWRQTACGLVTISKQLRTRRAEESDEAAESP